MEDANIWLWAWVALAVFLSVAEMFTAGFFLLPFGIGAACAAVLEFFWPGSVAWQWAAFIGVSALLLVVMRRFAERVTHEPPQKVAGDRLLGRAGVVVTRIEPHAPDGMVRVDREEWRADAPGFGVLEPGAAITVTAVEGAHLLVEPAGVASDADAG